MVLFTTNLSHYTITVTSTKHLFLSVYKWHIVSATQSEQRVGRSYARLTQLIHVLRSTFRKKRRN